MPKNLKRIFYDAGVGAIVFSGATEIVERTYLFSQEISPEIQEYVGTIGSNLIQYGLPTVVAVGMLAITYDTIRAFDHWQRRQTD